MDRPDAWMPHYIGDYIMETIHLTAQQDGIYMRLRAFYWKKGGPVPDNFNLLCRAARVSSNDEKSDVEIVVNSFFIRDDQMIRHAELDKRYQVAWEHYKKTSEAGKKAVAAREQKKLQRSNDVSIDEQTIPITTTIIKIKKKTTPHIQQAAGDESHAVSATEMMTVQEFRLLHQLTFKSVMNENLDEQADKICRRIPKEYIEKIFRSATEDGIDDSKHLLSHFQNKLKL